MSEKTIDAEKQKLIEQPEKSCGLKQKEKVQAYTCGPYPIHGPTRLAFKWKENVD